MKRNEKPTMYKQIENPQLTTNYWTLTSTTTTKAATSIMPIRFETEVFCFVFVAMIVISLFFMHFVVVVTWNKSKREFARAPSGCIAFVEWAPY